MIKACGQAFFHIYDPEEKVIQYFRSPRIRHPVDPQVLIRYTQTT
jgi:hypothetical protein